MGEDRVPNEDPMLAVEAHQGKEESTGWGHYVFWCPLFMSEAKPHPLPATYPWLKSQVRLQVWRHIPEASFPLCASKPRFF